MIWLWYYNETRFQYQTRDVQLIASNDSDEYLHVGSKLGWIGPLNYFLSLIDILVALTNFLAFFKSFW